MTPDTEAKPETGPLSTHKLETMVALVRQDVQSVARRVEEVFSSFDKAVQHWQETLSRLDDRMRVIEKDTALEKQRLDAAFKIIDELKTLQRAVQDSIKLTKDEVTVMHNRDILAVSTRQEDVMKTESKHLEEVESKLSAKADTSRLESFERRLQAVEALAPAMRAIMWVGALLGASIVALVWSLITGQASISFK